MLKTFRSQVLTMEENKGKNKWNTVKKKKIHTRCHC